ncbi:NADH-quinone oxidoreductase subunit N [Syntrophobacter sp. SbD1]|nr:NADH-quinone oxidoreductase subunit N [Syntrophobacter sp. SbD1]
METLKFILPAADYVAVLPQIILVATALVVLVMSVFKDLAKASLIGHVSLAGSALALAAVVFTGSGGPPFSSFSGMVLTDRFSFFLTLVICMIIVLTVLVSLNYQKFYENIRTGEYYALVLFAGVGMIFMATAGNLILLFVALETMSISIYALTGFHKDQLKSGEAALKYFLLGAFGSAFLLYGFAFVYGATGSLDIIKIASFIQTHPQILRFKFLVAGLVLMTAGFGFKISMVPFHMWTPDTYEGAPTSITGFMATGVKAAAFAALIRAILVPLAPMQESWIPIMWLAAVLTMTVGNIIALAQDNIKRMLAYSSIAHAGYILLGFVAGTNIAQAGMLFYLMAYAFMNIGAFAVVALLCKKGEEFNSISDFAGLGFKYPAVGLVMSVFLLSLAGIPPTGGFMGKFYIFTEALRSGYVWLVIAAGVNSVISIYYYLRVVVVMYFQPQAAGNQISLAVSPEVVVALAATATAVLFMGIFPSYFWSLASNSIFSLM